MLKIGIPGLRHLIHLPWRFAFLIRSTEWLRAVFKPLCCCVFGEGFIEIGLRQRGETCLASSRSDRVIPLNYWGGCGWRSCSAAAS